MSSVKEGGVLAHTRMMAGRSILWAAGLLGAMMLSASARVHAADLPVARDGGSTAAAGHRTTRLGLHVTQEELDIWRQRAVRGPYKSTGDASANSPGDWDRIKANADQFLRNPSAERWTGLNTPFKPSMHVAPEDRRYGSKLRDAGFAYLITGNTRYRDAVRSELLAQAAEPGVDFTNRSLWVMSFTGDGNPSFDIV